MMNIKMTAETPANRDEEEDLAYIEEERREEKNLADQQRAMAVLNKLHYAQICAFVACHVKSKRGAALVLDTLFALHLDDPERRVLYDRVRNVEGVRWLYRAACRWQEEYGIANERQLLTAYRGAKVFLARCNSLYQQPREDYFALRFEALADHLEKDPVIQAALHLR